MLNKSTIIVSSVASAVVLSSFIAYKIYNTKPKDVPIIVEDGAGCEETKDS